MGLFGIRKKEKVLDLSEDYHNQRRALKARESSQKSINSISNESSVASGFGFLSNIAGNVPSENSVSVGESNSDSEERKRRLTKMLADLTNRIEELSTQIYHLQQRVEVLEKKNNVSY